MAVSTCSLIACARSPWRLNIFIACVMLQWLCLRPSAQAVELDHKSGTLQEMIEYGMQGMNGVVSIRSLRNNGQDVYIYMISFYDPSRKDGGEGSYQPWRLIRKTDKSGIYEIYAWGDYIESLMSLQDAPRGRKFGMPGSGLPQGTTKEDGVLAADTVRLSANKELGDCGTVFDLHYAATGISYDVLVSKDTGKWIIVENSPHGQTAKYLDRGNQSRFIGVPRTLAFGVKADAPQPHLTDDIKLFDDYYGSDGQDRSKPENAGERCWWRDNFVIVYENQKPKYLSVALQKVTGEAFNQDEVLNIAKGFCGDLTWSPGEANDSSTTFKSTDNKYAVVWSHKAPDPQLVTVYLVLANPGDPNAPKPTIYDDPQVFENYYGTVQVNDVGWAKIRIWRRGNFVVMHMDCRPQRLILDVSKANRGDLSEVEIFEIADRYCGKLKWNSKGQNDKSTVYESDDKKCILNWFKNDPIDPKDPLSGRDHVTLTYPLRDDTLDKL